MVNKLISALKELELQGYVYDENYGVVYNINKRKVANLMAIAKHGINFEKDCEDAGISNGWVLYFVATPSTEIIDYVSAL